MFSLSDTPCQSILPNDGKIATKLWLAMGPFQIMLMSIRQTRSLDSRTYGYEKQEHLFMDDFPTKPPSIV